MRKMKLSDIRIKESFVNTTPKEAKMKKCRDNWNEWHRQDRYIVVDHDNTLIDGYIQYLVLKENGIEEAEIKISDRRKKRWYRKNTEGWMAPRYKNRMTTYIFGIHPDSKSTKERVWRVPNSWIGWEYDLLPGDKILVTTKHGIRPIIITRIEWLDKCPVDMPVKKVYRKLVNK